MIKLFLVFIFIYVAFTAIALNYAKAFRVKNTIVDFIETNEISDFKSFISEGSGSNQARIDKILDEASYTPTCRDRSGRINDMIDMEDGFCYRGVMIKRIVSPNISNKYVYYEVTTAVDWNLGALNLILTFGGSANDQDPLGGTWHIKGESRIIKHG